MRNSPRPPALLPQPVSNMIHVVVIFRARHREFNMSTRAYDIHGIVRAVRVSRMIL
jgi:hypothetical protein